MNKTNNEMSAGATSFAQFKRYDEAFKRQAVEHWRKRK